MVEDLVSQFYVAASNTQRYHHYRGLIVMFGIAGLMTLMVISIVAAVCLYALWPRAADLTSFNPHTMALIETSMWRHYYEKRYIRLFYELYKASRHVNFAPAASLAIAVKAAKAARAFQTSKSRIEARKALPALVQYFSAISAGAPCTYSALQAADLELAWWQARREFAAAESYGVTIGRVASLVYGSSHADMAKAGILRAQAMTYRDALGFTMTSSDWSVIEEKLDLSYSVLKAAILLRA
jgi:hypothetical protein